jgi:predicted AlkP superfamily pyrophosphatase or phosphodiesterase
MRGTVLPKRILAILLCLCAVACATVTGSAGVNAAQHLGKPYLVLISIDGFRWDYPDIHDVPAVRRLVSEGVRGERLLPVFPTLTFPNHYSIVTGMYPARHGLTANDFPLESGDWFHLYLRERVEDGRNYRGEPIWVTAEKQGMVTASFFWVGSEAGIQGIRPSHWRRYDKGITGTERVDQVLEWLAEPEAVRPHLYTLYFEDVDDYSHWYGLSSEENAEAIWRVDGYLQRLLDGLEKLPHGDQVNIVLVSDHGQADYRPGSDLLVIDSLADLEGVSLTDGGSYSFLHLDVPDTARAAAIRDAINANWAHGKAYLRDDAPPAWRVDSNPRFPDVFVVADVGHEVVSTRDPERRGQAGDHGWAPEAPEMHGIFIASGPAFRRGFEIGPVRIVDIHAILLEVLDLEHPGGTDGDPAALAGILK